MIWKISNEMSEKMEEYRLLMPRKRFCEMGRAVVKNGTHQSSLRKFLHTFGISTNICNILFKHHSAFFGLSLCCIETHKKF